MDPNACLRTLLELAKEVIQKTERDRPDAQDPEYLLAMATGLAEGILNLDEWLSKDGFLPKRWQGTV